MPVVVTVIVVVVTHAGFIAAGVGIAFSCVCDFCLFVGAIEGKWSELIW